MALYEDSPQNIRTKDAIDDTLEQYFRTNTKLIKDDGDNPSGEKLIDPDLKPLFRYHFGTLWGNRDLSPSGIQAGWVVLPKGRVIAIDPEIQRRDWNMEKMRNIVTLCNGGEDLEGGDDHIDEEEDNVRDYRAPNKPGGISIVNVYEDEDDRLTGNVPSYTTRANISLPLFASKAQAEEIEWGSVYMLEEDVTEQDDPRDYELEHFTDGLKPGDLVKSDENGRITKWDEEDDDREQIIGRVDQLSTELIPEDFLKWVMPDIEGENVPELLLNKMGYDSDDIIDSDFFDPSYADGYERNAYMPLGIPGLTDGMNITLQQEEIELLSVDATEVGDVLQLRIPGDKGLFDPETVELYDHNEWDLIDGYAEGAEQAESQIVEVTGIGDVTATGGEDEVYNITIEVVDNDNDNEEVTFDDSTNVMTVDLNNTTDDSVSDVETLIQGATLADFDGDPANIELHADDETTAVDSSNWNTADDFVLEDGRSEGPQRLEVTHTDPENHLITVEVLDTEGTDDMTIYGDFEATHAIHGIPTQLDWDGVVGTANIIINL